MSGVKIDWTKYFDRIWCISYIPYAKRRDAIKREFDRIGISDHPNFEWNLTFDSPYFHMCKRVLDANPSLGRLLSDTELKCWAGHYSCIKRSALFGDERILIIEDDSRFLNDINLLESILDAFPHDYDVVLFDYSVGVSVEEFNRYKTNKVNDFYAKFVRLNSTGCYSLSKQGISTYVSEYERKIVQADVYHYGFEDGLKKCFSLKPISCQVTYGDCMSVHNAGIWTIHNVYRKSGIIYSDYNMNDGKPYDYGDCIET